MKKILLAAIVAAVLVPVASHAHITVKYPAGAHDSITYYSIPIQSIVNAKTRDDMKWESAKIAVTDNAVVIPIGDDKGGYSYNIQGNDGLYFGLYAAPGDEVVADVVSLQPFNVNYSGTGLVAQSNQVDELVKPYMAQVRAMQSAQNADRSKLEALQSEMQTALKEFISEDPNSPAACFAVMRMRGQDKVDAYNGLSDAAKSSPIYPLLGKSVESEKLNIARERKLEEMQSGAFDAPAFTLKDIEGNEVNLSDFRGKWVILDFWGSWCGWCIKGFPELKEIYAQHKDNLVIIGIDNGDSEEAWKAAVAKYELPWVNVYNPEGSTVAKDYMVSAFPTKVLVNPDGKIALYTVGHTPDYTKAVEEAMSK